MSSDVDDAAQDIEVSAEQAVECALATQDCADADCADERREDHGDQDERVEEALAGEFVVRRENCEWERDEAGEGGGAGCDYQRVEKSGARAWIGEDEADGFERPAGFGGDIGGKPAANCEENGIDERDHQDGDEGPEEEVLDEVFGHGLWRWADSTRS